MKGMRSVILTLALATTASAQTWIGAGIGKPQSPYRGVDQKITAVPIIEVVRGRLRVSITEATYEIASRSPISFEAVAIPRFNGYDAEDSTALAGMHDRSWTLDVGLRTIIAPKDTGVALTATGDLLGKHSGAELSALAFHVWRSGYTRIAVAAGVVKQSAALADYYYGVRSDEAQAGRPAYSVGSMTMPRIEGVVFMPLSQRWLAVTRWRAERLSTEAAASPIVARRTLVSGYVGVGYRLGRL